MLLILLGRDMNTLSGTDFVYDKIVLWIFNTAIIYGAIFMVATSFVYGMFTGWGFFKYRFLIIKWILNITTILYLNFMTAISP